MRKDALMFARDPEQWSQLGVIGALMLIYIYNLRSLPAGLLADLTPYWRELAFVLNLALSGLVLVAVAARFLYVAVSLEGGAFWAVKSAPVGMGSYLLRKHLSGAVPLAVLMAALSVISSSMLDLGPALTALSGAVMLALAVSVGGMAVGMGAVGPRFRYESIAQVAMGMGAVVFMAAGFTAVAVTSGLVGYSLLILKSALLAGHTPGADIYARAVAALFGAVAINLIAPLAALRAGRRNLEGDLDESG